MSRVSKKEEAIKAKYDKLSQEAKPKPKYIKNVIMAFLVGGTICTIGQGIFELLKAFGISEYDVKIWLPIIMVFLGALLTGIGVYDKIANFAGAGTVVPITGFANSIVSPAMEYKREGFVLGVGANLFKIAGPVLVYGIGSSIMWIYLLYFYSYKIRR